MATDYELIRAELQTPTGGRVYTGDPDADAAEMNRPVQTGAFSSRRVSRRVIKDHLIANDKLLTILDGTNPKAKMTAYVLNSNDYMDGIDLEDPISKAMMAQLVALGVIAQADADAMIAEGREYETQTVPEAWGWGVSVTAEDIKGATA